MAVTTFKISGRKYVLLPESEFRKLTARNARNGAARPQTARMTRQDRGDVAESLRRLKSEKSVPYEQVRRELGL